MRLATVSGDGGGNAEQAVAEAFGFPTPCFVFRVGQEAVPGQQVGSERDNLAPDLVLGEAFQGEVPQAAGLRVADPVFGAGPAPVPPLELW